MGCLALTYYPRFELIKNSSEKVLTSKNTVLKRRNSYVFSYNGIEKVNEVAGIGNHYTALFGEYDPRTVYRWNQDPKPTIGISPYVMFNDNPIWYKDPLLDVPDDPIGSITKAVRTVIGLYHAAKVALNVVANTADKVNSAAKYVNKHTTPAQRQSAQLTAEFAFGVGPQTRHLDESSPITRDLMKSKLTAQARKDFYTQNKDALTKGDFDKVKSIDRKVYSFGLKGLATEGGNAQQFVGSATYTITLSDDHKSLNYEIYNETSEKSLFYHLPIDNHTREQNPIMGTTQQTYEFSEPVQVPKEEKKQ